MTSTSDEYFQKPYNELTVINDLLHNKPTQSILFGFRGDPPTTTSQRLKALTTGSFPTFLDISANFNSKRVTEDNVIHQLHQLNSTLLVIGDDTWQSLFPNQFDVNIPFDSFNTRVSSRTSVLLAFFC
jgi:phosphatidylinositol glycan class O